MADSDTIFDRIAPAYLPVLLRRVAARLNVAGDLYAEKHGIPWPARSNSMVAWLARNGGGTGKDIAEALGQSPQLVGQKLVQLREAGIVSSRRDPQDRRRQIETLTAKGKREFAKLEQLEQDATAAFADLFEELGCDVWDVLTRMDRALEDETFNDRMVRAKPR